MKRLICATRFLSLVLFSGGVFAQGRVAVATLNGETIWLEEVMRAVEGLPQEYRHAPMGTYFDQLVAEVIDTRLAAAAGYESNLDKDKAVAEAMKMAADRILAEAFLCATSNSQITDEAIRSADDACVADTASREQVTASHILVETEEAAYEIIAKLMMAAILPHWRRRIRQDQAVPMAVTLALSAGVRWYRPLKQPLLPCRLAVFPPNLCRHSLAGM